MPFPDGATALTHMLVVADLELSTAWYTDVLGASLFGTYGGTSTVVEILGNWLLIVTGGGPTPDKPTVTYVAPEQVERPSAQLIFRVDDCRVAYDELSARGAVFLSPPLDHGYEIRAFFRDPDGHLFEISELVSAARASET